MIAKQSGLSEKVHVWSQPDAAFVYGHVWVTFGLSRRPSVLGHDRFAAVGVPVRAVKGYRRAAADFLRKVVFRAQLAMVAELLAWATRWRKTLSRTLLWVVTDGALAKRPL